jgi:hypothetical protein
MRSYRNPFRYRTSEQESQQGLRRFLKTFGVGALDILPEHVWDRPVLIQSAPGAGKTSLLRTFAADALSEILARPQELAALHKRMSALGALGDGEVQTLGIRLALRRDYQAINDLRLDPEHSIKVFFRLLDAHLVREIASALITLRSDSDPHALSILPSAPGSDALLKIGGPGIPGMLAWAAHAHRELLAQLDSVLPPNLELLEGHHVPYAIRALSGARFIDDSRELSLKALVMFDDAQDLDPAQRLAVLEALADRELDLQRWLAERYQALSADEIVADEQPNRAYTPLRIESEARHMGEQRRRTRGRSRGFDRLLLDIGDLRASSVLYAEAEEERKFRTLLDTQIEADDPRVSEAIDSLDERLDELTATSERYERWLAIAREKHLYEGAIERRVVEILITRDLRREQGSLFAVVLSAEELKARRGSGLNEAAGLLLRHELKLPFYFGPERLAKLASENIEQHISLSGQLFEEMLARITLEETLALEPERQEMIVRRASETLWKEIPRRLAAGREIQQLLLNIAALCRENTYRPSVPYPPGPTATAISMRDRDKLLDPAWREQTEGAEQLFRALAGAIAHNLLASELDYNVKGERWMVLNINRLLCPRFGLALGLGGIRERPVETLCGWMLGAPPAEDEILEQPLQERLAI